MSGCLARSIAMCSCYKIHDILESQFKIIVHAPSENFKLQTSLCGLNPSSLFRNPQFTINND